MNEFISETEIRFLLGLLLGLVSGFLIGAERESRSKDAGISTHMLVITGAMLFTFLSMHVDPASKSRIAAQVVTGIGFLGAGLILKKDDTVKNLTTAASLWVAASIGMAYGFGYYATGIIVAIVVALIPRVPHLKHKKAKKDLPPE
ncbi:MAG: MgtC/SapB family protein [Saezia sp.]